MTQIGAPKHDPINIGTEASPPFAVLPQPETLFARRARRFESLASGHPLAAYLTFAGRITALQADALSATPPPSLPEPQALKLAQDGAMPPLPLTGLAEDAAFKAAVTRLTQAMRDDEALPAQAREAAGRVAALGRDEMAAALDAVIVDAVPAERIAEHVIVAAALQVRMSRAAAALDVATLQPIADGVCPACGAAPVSSSVVGRPGAQNARYCTCSVCATEWNVVRVKCVACSSTGGITYQSLAEVGDGEGANSAGAAGPAPNDRRSKLEREMREARDVVKGETCDACKGYVKILYQVKDHNLEAVADDTASLGLDIKLAEQGWQRKGRNLFLMGYGLKPAASGGRSSSTCADAGEDSGHV